MSLKNKHLVLLFLIVLFAGWVARRIPWPYRSASLKSALFTVDPADVYGLRITHPDGTDLLIEHTPAGWMAEQDGRSVPIPQDSATALIGLLTEPVALERPSNPASARMLSPIRLQLLTHRGPTTWIEIGSESASQTLVRFPWRQGLYCARVALRSRLPQSPDALRERRLLPCPPTDICQITFAWPNKDSSLTWEKNPISRSWYLVDDRKILSPQDSATIPRWLNAVARLNHLPFADFFEEEQDEHQLHLVVTLTTVDQTSVTLRFFKLSPVQDLEDPSLLLRQGMRTFPSHVVHSSANPLHFFALSDEYSIAQLHLGPY